MEVIGSHDMHECMRGHVMFLSIVFTQHFVPQPARHPDEPR